MKKLLIADDQRGIRLLLSEVFRQEGYHVYLAANGVEALQLIRDEQPNCILLDMEMPGLNGAEVLSKLRIDWPDMPVILMTAHTNVELAEEVIEDVLGLFTKPFDIYEVRDAVKRVLKN